MIHRSGFVALIAVLIMSAVALTIGTGLVVRAIGQGNISVTNDLGDRSYAAASACTEIALMKLKNSNSYAGNETITLDSGDTCHILAPGGTGNTNRIIYATSTVMTITRKMQVNIANINSVMSITSWQDVVNF